MALHNERRSISTQLTDAEKFALTAKLSCKYRSIARDYRFEPILAHHLPQLMDLCKGFMQDDSPSQATGSTLENTRTAMESLVVYSIAANSVFETSQICFEQKTNKAVGFRLVSPLYRDDSKAPFSVPEPKLSKQELTLLTPIHESWNKLWDIYPTEDVIMRIDLIYVDRAHRMKGIFQTWLDYNLDYPAIAKQTGANYFGILCSSNATKGWCKKLGFVPTYTSPDYVTNIKGEKVKLPQGEMQVFTADMHKMFPINVKPIWDEMMKEGML